MSLKSMTRPLGDLWSPRNAKRKGANRRELSRDSRHERNVSSKAPSPAPSANARADATGIPLSATLNLIAARDVEAGHELSLGAITYHSWLTGCFRSGPSKSSAFCTSFRGNHGVEVLEGGSILLLPVQQLPAEVHADQQAIMRY